MTGSEATLAAAVLAASLSALTLIITTVIEITRLRATRKDETTKWLRETLHQAALSYISASFAISGYASRVRRERSLLSAQVLQERLDDVRESHSTMTKALTSFRLLAPDAMIHAAEAVHDAHHLLINAAFHELPVPSDEDFGHLRTTARESLVEMINQTRAPLGLDVASVEVGAHGASEWTIAAHQTADPQGSPSTG